MLRKLHKIYCQSSKYKADKERKVHSIRYPHITDYTQQTMWRKIFVCVVFIIPMMYIQEATSQRNCEMTRCGPNMTCNATTVPNCQCRPEYGRNFSGHCIRKCDLIECGQGTVCILTPMGDPQCQSKCDLIECGNGTVCNLGETGNPICQTQCEITPCGSNMTCNVTAVGGPTCQCRPGFRNSSGHCIHVCENNRCGENAICTYNSSTVEHHVCTCKQGFNDTVVESVRMCLAIPMPPTASTPGTGQDQNMAGVIAAAVVSGIIAIVMICLIIYAVVRYRSRFKRPSDNPLDSNVRMTDSVTEHYFRGSSSSLDITINTQVIVETRSESNAKQGNGGSPGQIKVQEASSDYDMETLYGNGNIPENKRLALENKSVHLDNLYSNSSIAENKRRDLEDKTARQVAELSPLDDEDKCEDGDQPRYNTLTETGFANGVAGSKNFSLSASTDCTAEKNDCEYNHLRLKVL